MKLISFETVNHPGLGSIQLSFLDPSGVEYDTIIFAGGNGTGKSSILDAIQRAIEGALGANIGIISLDIRLNPSEVVNLASGLGIAVNDSLVNLRVDTSQQGNWNGHQLTFVNSANAQQSLTYIPNQPSFRGVFSSFFNEAALNFNPGQIGSATALDVDTGDQAIVRSGEALANQIAQLIIDVRNADAEDLANWVSQNPGMAPPASVQERRFSRFRAAFDYMFPTKRFSKIQRRQNRIDIEFEEYGNISNISQLSSGEKQIVFRAGFLLRELGILQNGIVLFDEPELSLHPEWQERIVPFYKQLLSSNAGVHPQLFIATHSPFIVHESANSKVVILEKDALTGKIQEASKPTYPIVAASAAVRAFNINSFLNSAQHPLLLLTEGASDATIIRTAWAKLHPTETLDVEIRPALGDRNIQITLNDSETFKRAGNRLLAGLFDFDTAYNQWNGLWRKNSTLVSSKEADCMIKKHDSELGWALLLPVPTYRSQFASVSLKGNSIMSIEFLFENSHIPSHMIDYVSAPMGVNIPTFKDSEKSNFAIHVDTLPSSAFAAFNPLFDRISDILTGRL